MASNNIVAEDWEQVALKVEQLRGIQPSSSYGREESSKTVKKVSWLEMAMQDAQKGKDSRNRVSSKKGPIHTTGIASVSEGATVVADPV
jgi:hypothetical protein